MAPKTTAVWFRKCLRLHDNAPLVEAAKRGGRLLPIFVLDPHFARPEFVGAPRYRFLLESLADLDASLRKRGSRLCVVRGETEATLDGLFAGACDALPGVKVDAILWEEELVEPWGVARDARAPLTRARGVGDAVAGGHLLFDPREVLGACGGKAPTTMPAMVKAAAARRRRARARDGARGVRKPKTKSTKFDVDPSTTVLSPYLKFGCVSARLFRARLADVYAGGPHAQPPTSLLGQLYFREMAYANALKHGAAFAASPSPVCADIPWDDPATDAAAAARLRAWEAGRTGYPFVDAAMRQLKETGWIHHLARHAVACFLTRGDLWLPWTEGARVFDRDLLDADWAVNNFNWLGLAGVASWSPPFFRVYSPVPNHKQSSLNVDEAAGAYVDRFVPELRKLPAKYKYAPWTAPAAVLAAAGVVLGDTYPRPLVDHKVQSKDNIARFKEAQQRNRANKPKPPPKGAPKTKKQKV
ncbi:DNA photolyase [Aureococcus anophagefferens]|nr:DNA photolyase [Aureococcus anophagefferens]